MRSDDDRGGSARLGHDRASQHLGHDRARPRLRPDRARPRLPWALVAWARGLSPLAVDAALAALLLGISLVILWSLRHECACRDAWGALAVVLVVAQTVPLVWRRHHPLATSVVVGAACTAYGLAPLPDLVTNVPPGGLVALYSMAAYCSRRTAAIVGAVVGVVVLAALLPTQAEADFLDYLLVYLLLGSAWMLGDLARTRRAYTAQLEDRAVRLERERELESGRAVAEERARIARELHDVVAHNVSMMVVQAEAGPVVVERDPGRAVAAFDSIAATGRQALGEMRRLLGVLREGDQTLTLAPQPGIDQLPELVERVRRAGVPVELVIEGEPAPLPPGVDLSAYRIVQEALTNTVKHAGPSRARVRVCYGERHLELEVTDDGRGPGGAGNGRPGGQGQGLIGMRERVGLFGGRLEAGPRPEGGFAVVAHLPVDQAG
ncbi:MAG TPA: sensor histidine kinase [Actinomycetes bacterium]|nr:sensor histidine kinase [Actinomycetes bacterium]